MARNIKKEGLIGKALRTPSARTQLEASITGIVIMLIASLTSCAYVIFFSDYTLFWKIVTGVGEIGVLLMMLSSLATTYVQLYQLKMSMGLMGNNPLTEILNQINGMGEKVKKENVRGVKKRKKKVTETPSQSLPSEICPASFVSDPEKLEVKDNVKGGIECTNK